MGNPGDVTNFSGGVAVITGAGSGIGAALARHAATLGMQTIIADISAENANAVTEEIQQAGGTAEAYVVDVTIPEEVENMAEAVFTKYGGVTLLINNAGIEVLGQVWEVSPAQWQKVFAVNVLGVVNSLRAFVPRMLKSGKESWLSNVASQIAVGHLPGQGAYSASKHAVQNITETLFLELDLLHAPIHVSTVIPGMVQTSIFKAALDGGDGSVSSRFRHSLAGFISAHGQDANESAKRILRSIAANEFWIATHPEHADEFLTERADFLKEKRNPAISEQSKALWQACLR
jgi:NAD(P)-dependent dehydrogenase (short-subunit alcohol dehydrogenase family)